MVRRIFPTKKITKKEVLNLWKSCSVDEIGVYVHNPFCMTICDYCCYQGTKYNEEDYKKYYNEYLPKVIDFYQEIIKDKQVKSWFFGGGTPSLMSASDLDKLLSSLPSIRQGEKTFELHPAFWEEEQLDILQKYNFDNLIIGVQSFNKDLLKRVNRPTADFKEISKLVDEVKRRDMNLCMDIIGFMKANNFEEEGSIFINDLEKAHSLNPEEISLQIRFDSNLPKKYHEFFLTKIIESDFYNDDAYKNTYFYSLKKELKELKSGKRKEVREEIIRFIKNDLYKKYPNKFFSFLPYQGSYFNYDHPTLGIGSYRNKKGGIVCSTGPGSTKKTFSKLKVKNHPITLSEVNEGEDFQFYYHDVSNNYGRLLNVLINKVRQEKGLSKKIKTELSKATQGIKKENSKIIKGELVKVSDKLLTLKTKHEDKEVLINKKSILVERFVVEKDLNKITDRLISFNNLRVGDILKLFVNSKNEIILLQKITVSDYYFNSQQSEMNSLKLLDNLP